MCACLIEFSPFLSSISAASVDVDVVDDDDDVVSCVLPEDHTRITSIVVVAVIVIAAASLHSHAFIFGSDARTGFTMSDLHTLLTEGETTENKPEQIER